MVFALTWIDHKYTCVPPIVNLLQPPSPPIPLGCSQALALGALLHALSLRWSSILHMVMYMFQCYSLKSSHPCFKEKSLFWEQIDRLLLLLLSHYSRVRLCVTPWTAAHQAPPSLGFSRQEHWSGLPFPSPMHESEKWKWSRSVLSDC